MPGESIEVNISKNKPKTEERDVWEEFHKYVHLGKVDKVLELAVFLREQGREEDAKKVLNKAYEIEGQNFRKKAEELSEGFDQNKDNDE
jgi:hypothetical protein